MSRRMPDGTGNPWATVASEERSRAEKAEAERDAAVLLLREFDGAPEPPGRVRPFWARVQDFLASLDSPALDSEAPR